MEFFVQKELLDFQEDDKEVLISSATEAKKFSNFTPNLYLANDLSNFCNFILQLCTAARASYLLNMTLMDDFQFFESPTLDDMLKNIIDSPQKILDHLETETLMHFSLLILRIHSDIGKFCELVYNNFSIDSTLSLVFSNSTFPALFGFFCFEDFCVLGAQMIHNLLPKNGMQTLVQSMIVSFYFSVQFFYENLWANFYFEYRSNFTRFQIFDSFSNSLKKSVQYLTPSHVKVFKEFKEIYPDNVKQLLIEIIFDPLRNKGIFGTNAMPWKDFKYLFDFFENLPPRGYHILENIISSNENFVHYLPTLPSSNVLQRIPFVMSDRDVHTLIEIAMDDDTFASDFKQLIHEIFDMYKKGYSSFYVYLITPISKNKNNQTKQNINNQYKREFIELQKLCTKNKVSYLTFLPKTPFFQPNHQHIPSFCYKKNFQVFALQNFIEETSKKIDTLDCVLELRYQIKLIKNQLYYMNSIKKSLLNRYAIKYFKGISNNPNNILSNQEIISIANEKIDPTIFENVSYVLSNLYHPEHDPLLLYVNEFFSIFFDVENRIKFLKARNPQITYVLKFFKNKMSNFVQLNRSRQIAKLFEITEIILSANIFQLANSDVFELALFKCSNIELLFAFVVFRRLIYQNKIRKTQSKGYNTLVESLNCLILCFFHRCKELQEAYLEVNVS